MNDEERADWLARAIDDLLNRDRQRPKEPPPPELDRQELNALMRIASARAEAADSLMHAGLQYEGEVWQRVVQRLDRRRHPRTVKPFDATETITEADAFAAARELEGMEDDELREIARMRRQMAERAASIAESHRAEVWKRVQSRLESSAKKKGLFGFFRRAQNADRLAAALDRVATGRDVADSEDEEIDSLVQIARSRTYWSHLTRKAAEERESRLWDRISTAITERGRHTPAERAVFWPKLAIAGAAVALVIAALGPLPATGFADHPLVKTARSFGEHIGVWETQTPPEIEGAPVVTEGIEMTEAEASERLGVAVVEPADSPEGFALTSSRYFEVPLTADAGGTFALTYTAGDAAIVIYQELATDADFAVEGGSATDVALGDGTPATYVEGMWHATADGVLEWSEGGAQTLVFERNGVRTTIQYTGPEADAPSLFAIADSMALAR